MIPTLASQQRIALLRAKAAANQLTEQEMAEAIILMRAERVGAAVASETSRRKKAIAEIPDADEMLKDLMGGGV